MKLSNILKLYDLSIMKDTTIYPVKKHVKTQDIER